MKIAFLGSNEKEVQALNIFFLKNFAPKEGLELRYVSNSRMEYYNKNTGDLYYIRIMNPSIKGYKFNRIFYSRSIYINDNFNEDNMYYIYSTLIIRNESDRNNTVIELSLEEFME